MPDLNYNTAAVHDSMFSIAAFWLDSMHVDGFRLDAVANLIYWPNRDEQQENHDGIEFLRKLSKESYYTMRIR